MKTGEEVKTYEYKIGLRSGDSGADGKILVSSDAGEEGTVALFRGLCASWTAEEYDEVVLGAAASDKPPHLTFVHEGGGNDISQPYSWFWD